MTKIVAIMFALGGGIAIALQRIVNSALGRSIGNLEGTFVSFLVGGVAAGLLSALLGTGELRLATQVSPILLTGGLFGVIIVFTTLTAVQVLGTVSALTLTIVGQLLTALVIDYFGLFGSLRISLDWSRILGVVLLIIAAKLIVK